MHIHLLRKLAPYTLFVLILAGCGNDISLNDAQTADPASRTYFIFDTIVKVRVYDQRMTETHFDRIGELFTQIDERMNRRLAGSQIDLVNRQAGVKPVPVSEDTFHVVQTALNYAEASGGRFDPSVGPLVDAWGIGSESAAVPSQEEIARALKLVDYRLVAMNEDEYTVQLGTQGMSLDLGAIAKGYAADAAADELTGAGFESAIIDLGGNIMAMGSKPDGSAWSIGIQDPAEVRGDYLGTLRVKDKTIVTSGVYERFFKANNRVYHHILSTEDGYPVDNELLSVTIVSDSSMDADAMSTAVFAMGLAQGKSYIEQRGDADAVFVTQDKEVHITSGLKGNFTLTNDAYALAE